MTEIYGIYAIFLLISTIITLYLAFYSWNKRSNNHAIYFSLLMLSVSIWTVMSAFEMASTALSTKVICSQLSYLGIVFIGPLWALFAISYTGHDKWIKNSLITVLFIVPIITLILVATNGIHGLIWPTITPSSSLPGSLLIYGHGFGFYVNAVYTYFLMFLGLILLFRFYISRPKLYKKQVLLVLVAAIIPLIGNAIYIIQQIPVPGLDITLFAFTVSGILVAWSIFKFKMLEIVLVAYNNLFNKMSTGALVLDSQQRIVDLNTAAENLLDINQEIIGSFAHEKLHQFNTIFPLEDIKTEIKTEIKINKPDIMWLDLQVMHLNKKEELLGWLITFRDISIRKKAEKSLKKSEKKYRDLVDNALVGIYKTDLEGNLLFANDALSDIFGYSSTHEMEKINILSRYKNLEDRNFILNNLKDDGSLMDYEVELLKKTGEPMNIILSATMDGETISGMMLDLTESKKSEVQLKNSLHEKEMLLKEIHHRVKNNLMVISSLLSLQSRYIKDEASKNIFRESQNRARSMALIHELLYQSDDLKRINFGNYIKTIAEELFRMYVTDQSVIKLNMNVEEVMVDINTAIPLGLIVNELVSNSMKHAFLEGRKGEIIIEFKSNAPNYILVVGDNGVGFPKDWDYKNMDTLGLRIVNSLTEQINGQIKLDKKGGTKFTIEFKEENY